MSEALSWCLSLTPACLSSQLDLSVNVLCGVNYGQGTYTAEGITAIADALRVNASLTSVSLLANKFDNSTVEMLLKLKEGKPTLTTLCGLTPDQEKAYFAGWGLTLQDVKLLAPEIAVHASLTSVRTLANKPSRCLPPPLFR